METKSTKQRLDELYDLLKSEYITENEFRAARSNILRESGFDLSPAPRPRRDRDAEVTQEERRALQQPERKGCGCGCFLFTLFLIAAIALGAIFALPEWPDRFGGPYVRMARERLTKLWTSAFSPDKPAPDPVKPDGMPTRPTPAAAPAAPQTANPPVSADEPAQPSEPSPASADVPPAAQSPEPQSTAQTLLSREIPSSIPVPDHAGLPSPDIGLPALPDNSLSESLPAAKPDITVIEIAPSAPTPSTYASLTTENEIKHVQGYITANSARIRSTPDASIRTNVTGWGRKGDRFAVLEEGTDKDGAKWYRVRYEEGNKEGWISSSLVKLEQ